MRNVHSRRIAAPVATVSALLDRLSGPDDAVWPTPTWWPLRLDGPLAVGSRGGHGPVRYGVTARGPGLVRFAFAPGVGLRGTHEYAVVADGPDACVLTHVLTGRAHGSGRVLWPVLIRWCHDALIEKSLDNAETAATGAPPARPHRPGAWVRLCRRWLADRPRPVRPADAAVLAAEAFERPDYRDAYEVRLRPGMPTDPAHWAREVFFHRPFPTYAASEREILIGDVRPVDFRVSFLVEGERLEMSTLVRFRRPSQRRYFRLIAPFHRLFARAMLRRALRRECRPGAAGAPRRARRPAASPAGAAGGAASSGSGPVRSVVAGLRRARFAPRSTDVQATYDPGTGPENRLARNTTDSVSLPQDTPDRT